MKRLRLAVENACFLKTKSFSSQVIEVRHAIDIIVDLKIRIKMVNFWPILLQLRKFKKLFWNLFYSTVI